MENERNDGLVISIYILRQKDLFMYEYNPLHEYRHACVDFFRADACEGVAVLL